MKTIKPKCPKCGHELEIRLKIVEKLENRITELEAKLYNSKKVSPEEDFNVDRLKNMFGMK